ncbi:MAG: hypothetical protein ACPGXK_04205 [Phycisphaerae bacterium]
MPQFPEDGSLLDDLPDDVEVIRHQPPSARRQRSFWEIASWFDVGPSGKVSFHTHDGADATDDTKSSVASTRDDEAVEAWASSSIDPLVALHERVGFSAIFSSFSPISNHRVARVVAARTGLPWVADFRDLWTDDYRYHISDPEVYQSDRDEEVCILRSADSVIGVTPQQTRMLADRLLDESDSANSSFEDVASRFATITNGFDVCDFEACWSKPLQRNVRFVMSHVGRMDRKRVSEAFLSGLAQLSSWLGEHRSRFLFRVVGHCQPSTRERLVQTGIPCEFVDYLPHVEAISAMRHSDLLLVVVPKGRHADTTIPAKPFEYLATGRPLLLVGPSMGACAELISTTGGGQSVSHNPLEVFRALKSAYQIWERGDLARGCSRAMLTRFERENLAAALASQFDGVCGVPSGTPVVATGVSAGTAQVSGGLV